MLPRFFGAEQFGKFPAFVRPVAEHPAHWSFCLVGHLRHLLILCLLTHQQNERMSVPREKIVSESTIQDTSACPLWVKSRHMRCTTACPLYSRKRHQMRHRGNVRFGPEAD